MKKLIALVFMVCVVLAISIPAFAEGDNQAPAGTQQAASDTQQPAATQPSVQQSVYSSQQPAPTVTEPAPAINVPTVNQQKQAVAAQQKQIADLQKQIAELQKQKQANELKQKQAASAQQQKQVSQQQKQTAAAQQQKLAATLQQQNATIQKLMAMLQKLMGGNVNADKTTTDIENELNADTNADLSALTAAAKEDIASREDKSAFKGKLDYLFTELNDLRAVCSANWEAIKGLNNVIKTEWTRIKTDLKGLSDKAKADQILTGLKNRLEPLRTIVKDEQAKVKSLREAKTAQWVIFRAAVKARNLDAATVAMKNIISLKSQIISEQPKIMAAKQEIIKVLKDVIVQ